MSEYVDGELDGHSASDLERHVRWCPDCRRMLAGLTRTIGGLRRLGDANDPADPAANGR